MKTNKLDFYLKISRIAFWVSIIGVVLLYFINSWLAKNYVVKNYSESIVNLQALILIPLTQLFLLIGYIMTLLNGILLIKKGKKIYGYTFIFLFFILTLIYIILKSLESA